MDNKDKLNELSFELKVCYLKKPWNLDSGIIQSVNDWVNFVVLSDDTKKENDVYKEINDFIKQVNDIIVEPIRVDNTTLLLNIMQDQTYHIYYLIDHMLPDEHQMINLAKIGKVYSIYKKNIGDGDISIFLGIIEVDSISIKDGLFTISGINYTKYDSSIQVENGRMTLTYDILGKTRKSNSISLSKI